MQAHADYHEDEHEVIPIEVYEQSPGKYKKVFCDQHPQEPLIKACKQCSKLVCNECDRTEDDCTGKKQSCTFRHNQGMERQRLQLLRHKYDINNTCYRV